MGSILRRLSSDKQTEKEKAQADRPQEEGCPGEDLRVPGGESEYKLENSKEKEHHHQAQENPRDERVYLQS